MNSDNLLELRLRRAALFCFLATVCVNIISLMGWASGFLIVASIKPHYVPIAPSTAITFSLLAASLFVHVLHPSSSIGRVGVMISALLTFLVSTLVLVGFFLGITFAIESLGFNAPTHPSIVPIGHMSPMTSAILSAAALGSLSLVLSYKGKQNLKNLAAFLGAGLILCGFIVVVGYLYGTPLLYGGAIIPVALTTAVAFMLLGLGLINASGPDVLPVRVFTGTTVRSRLMRAFLPAVVSLVVVYGLLYEAAYKTGNPALIASLVAVLSVLVVGIIVSRLARRIGNEIDHANAERMKALEALHSDMERLRLAQDAANSGTWEWDLRTNDNVWSEELWKVYGIEPHSCEPSYEAWRQIVHPDDRERSEQIVQEAARNGTELNFEFRVRDRDGKERWLLSRGRPQRDADGQVVRFVGIAMDITGRKEAEQEREMLIVELQKALDEIRQLSGLLPICSYCKKIRDDKGYWNQLEAYITEHTGVLFSHSFCPDCAKKAWADLEALKKSNR